MDSESEIIITIVDIPSYSNFNGGADNDDEPPPYEDMICEKFIKEKNELLSFCIAKI